MSIALRILLIFVFAAVLGSTGTNSTHSDIFQPTRCRKDGPLIQFPFRLTNSQPQHSSFGSAFDLHCNQNQQTILQLTVSVNVSLTQIDYISQTIVVEDPDNCLARNIPTLNLSTSPFNFSLPECYWDLGGDDLYNCSTDLEWDHFPISCLSSNGDQVIAVGSDELMERFPSSSCTRLLEVRSVPYIRGEFISLRWKKTHLVDNVKLDANFAALSNATGVNL